MPIVPDAKDWTWVLERTCDECGFDPSATAFESIPSRVRSSAAVLTAALNAPNATVRPDDSTWSALEYAAHVRDVCRIFEHRLDITRTGSARPGPLIGGYDTAVTIDDSGIPMFANWDQDETARAENYAAQDITRVAADLRAAAETTARAYESVPADELNHPAKRSNGSLFTVQTLGRYFLHDVVHHAHDVENRGTATA
ncbi:DinB family protein [Nocardia sp. NBC_01503]|uniref:DinB family protein n=1 Tax=Nocardia sp. NBC_01503 TaxID=2975997 RepID=UPI002E7B3A70|nr:DinB family protein [Nocardia sp. NBC_01503]WTL29512.1 DinB family protein [Nocardia sp. NBC_01503]